MQPSLAVDAAKMVVAPAEAEAVMRGSTVVIVVADDGMPPRAALRTGQYRIRLAIPGVRPGVPAAARTN